MIRKQIAMNEMRDIIESLPGHTEDSMKAMLEYWMEKIIVRHFEFGNETAYNYPKLDPRYLERKRKKWGDQPMLVASGVLRESVTTMYKIYKIKNKFRIIFTIPRYGQFVRNLRDWTIINKRDRRDLLRFRREKLVKIRRIYISRLKRKKSK